MKNEKITKEEFIALFSAILVSRNDGILNLMSFFLFIEDCDKKKKYLDLIKLNEKEISSFIQKIRNIYDSLKENKIISSFYSELDNVIYIYDDNYLEVIKKHIDYFIEVSDFINDYYNYEDMITYNDNDESFYRVIS